MKFALVLVLVTGLSSIASANSVTVECKAPNGLMGNAATMSGVIQIDSEKATGKLQVFVGGSTRQPVLDAEVNVAGALLDDGALTMLASDNELINIIYVNPHSKDISYVEIDGSQYLSNCAVE